MLCFQPTHAQACSVALSAPLLGQCTILGHGVHPKTSAHLSAHLLLSACALQQAITSTVVSLFAGHDGAPCQELQTCAEAPAACPDPLAGPGLFCSADT